MGYMMSRGPFWLYSSLMPKCLLKGQGNGNINFLPPLRVFLDLTTPMCVLSVQEGLLLQNSLCRRVTEYRDREAIGVRGKVGTGARKTPFQT